MISIRLLALALLTALGACASRQASGDGRERSNPNILAGAELQGQPGITLYDHVRRVRPNWLTPRGVTSIRQASEGVVVYRDGVRMGSVEYLREVTIETVERVQFLTGAEAASRFGLDHQHGAILVTTRK